MEPGNEANKKQLNAGRGLGTRLAFYSKMVCGI